MPTLRQLLCTSLATSLFLTSGTAEARFGKSSNSSSSSSSNGKVHDASPVGSSDNDNDSGGSSSGGSSSGGSSSVSDTVNTVGTILDILFFVADTAARAQAYESAYRETVHYEPPPSPPAVEQQPGQQPMYPYGQEPVVVQQQRPPEERRRNPLMFRLGVDGQALGAGSSVAFNAGIEGQHWGVAAGATGLRLATDDGTPGEDRIDLASAHLTLALFTDDQTRLRLEGGVAWAKAPDALFAGPSFALTFERCLFGSLDLEARAQVVPVPYTQLDTQAGLALHLNAITLRTGWRFQMLDDRGQVDGVVHRDYFSGPYAGIGLNF
ncbi:hypothetical protein ACN28E_50975 [Archangium lansingense]|uniref:hypothetical protein n=1 Tax=Archangium lansingense TaxID=2995310 RepID=UPI003B76D0E3